MMGKTIPRKLRCLSFPCNFLECFNLHSQNVAGQVGHQASITQTTGCAPPVCKATVAVLVAGKGAEKWGLLLNTLELKEMSDGVNLYGASLRLRDVIITLSNIFEKQRHKQIY